MCDWNSVMVLVAQAKKFQTSTRTIFETMPSPAVDETPQHSLVAIADKAWRQKPGQGGPLKQHPGPNDRFKVGGPWELQMGTTLETLSMAGIACL